MIWKAMDRRPEKKALLTIFFVVFFDLLSFGIVIPILPYYSRTFGANAFELGWLMAIYSVAQFLCAPFWGALSDRVGRRPVLLATILAGSCSMAATALAGSYATLFLARLLAGIFAANISTASAYIADVTTAENRAKGMGIIGAGFGLGFIFGPAIGGMFSVYGFAAPILLAAFLSLANFVFAYFFLTESKAKENARRPSREAFREAFSRKPTSVPVALFFLNTLAFTQMEVIFGFFVLARFGYGARNAGYLLAGTGFVSALLQGGLIGRLAKKFGEKNLLPFGFLALGLALTGAAFSPTPGFFMLALFFLAVGNGLVNPSLSSLVSKGALPGRQGTIMGIYQSAGSLSRIIGPPVAGFLFDQIGPPVPLLVSAGIMAAALLAAILYKGELA